MKLRVSLPTKIALLALLNIVVLSLVLLAFAMAQSQLDLQSFLRAPARDRILAVRGELQSDLSEGSTESRRAVLDRYQQTYGVSFFLTDYQGKTLADPTLVLPPEILKEMAVRHFDFNFRRPAVTPGGTTQRTPPPVPTPPIFYVSTRTPERFWVGTRTVIRDAASGDPLERFMILASDSRFGHGFFFDPTPFIVIALAVIVLSTIIWFPLIRGITRSVSQMQNATQRIADGDFDPHIQVDRSDELGHLGSSINRLSVRLAGFVKGQKRFLADIAHELSSPVARMQFALSILERKADDTQHQNVVDLQEEVAHMSGLINELLSFSKAGMQTAPVVLARTSVADIVRKVIDRESHPGVDITVNIDPSLSVLVEPDHFSRALSNLVRNAVRYAGDAGPIRISARPDGDEVVISVADSGPGLPEEALDDVFRPFYRPEAARNRDTGGVGLGLAIVRACIEACKGTVTCRNLQPSGLEVEVRVRRDLWVEEPS